MPANLGAWSTFGSGCPRFSFVPLAPSCLAMNSLLASVSWGWTPCLQLYSPNRAVSLNTQPWSSCFQTRAEAVHPQASPLTWVHCLWDKPLRGFSSVFLGLTRGGMDKVSSTQNGTTAWVEKVTAPWKARKPRAQLLFVSHHVPLVLATLQARQCPFPFLSTLQAQHCPTISCSVLTSREHTKPYSTEPV